jgi:hypothetical protein
VFCSGSVDKSEYRAAHGLSLVRYRRVNTFERLVLCDFKLFHAEGKDMSALPGWRWIFSWSSWGERVWVVGVRGAKS